MQVKCLVPVMRTMDKLGQSLIRNSFGSPWECLAKKDQGADHRAQKEIRRKHGIVVT